MASTLRDATHAEIRDEPSIVLQALVDGAMTATWVTREIAKNELEARKPYDFASRGVLSSADRELAVARAGELLMGATIEALERPVSEPVSLDALREAKAAYDRRYPHGVEPQLELRTDTTTEGGAA